MYIGMFAISLGVLLFASDKFIDAAEKIGLSLGISPFIIGVTIVAFGTSLPELATSIASVFSNSSEIVVGNVVGSNITNILLVLGVTALLGKQIRMDFDVMDIDMPLLFGSAFLMFFTLQDGVLSTFEALLYLVGLVIFLMNSFGGDKTEKEDRPKASWQSYALLLVAGVLVYFGADFTIRSIKEIGAIMEISNDIIALTAVALGTSLPEIFVSAAAVRRGKHAIAVGNVLGSNIFNTYAVMSIPSFFGDLIIPDQILDFGLPFMLVITILFGMICLSKRISFWEGAMMIVFYIYFMGETFLST